MKNTLFAIFFGAIIGVTIRLAGHFIFPNHGEESAWLSGIYAGITYISILNKLKDK